MEIILKQLVPLPLQDFVFSENSIWKQTTVFQAGQSNLVCASSGKGKTSFTHIIAGIRKDYHGDLVLDGRLASSLNSDDWAELRREKLAFIFQDLQLLPSLSLRENLLLKNGLTKRYSEQELLEFARCLQIDQLWNQSAGTLSLGQQQRVAIIRGLAQPFEYLVMDEPFSHLDLENTKRAFALIQERCAAEKAGYILTSLDPMADEHFDQLSYF